MTERLIRYYAMYVIERLGLLLSSYYRVLNCRYLTITGLRSSVALARLGLVMYVSEDYVRNISRYLIILVRDLDVLVLLNDRPDLLAYLAVLLYGYLRIYADDGDTIS